MKQVFNRIVIAALALIITAATAQAVGPIVLLHTNRGDIYIELNPTKAPKTVTNFLKYVNRDFYNGLIFHRVADLSSSTSVENFIIQAGADDPNLYDPNLSGGNPNYFSDPNWIKDPRFFREPNAPIVNESTNGLSNLRGTIAMARTSDPNSATSQFFINVNNNTFLDRTGSSAGYCVFGAVIKGLDVADTIADANVYTIGAGAYKMENVPVQPIIILQAEQITDTLTVTHATAKASLTRHPPSDSFTADGSLNATATQFTDSNSVTITIAAPDANNVNTQTISRSEFKQTHNKAVFTYNNSLTMVTSLKLDLDDPCHPTFALTTRNLNLSGVNTTVRLGLQFGSYFGLADPNETVINGKKPIPIQFLSGVADALRVYKFRFIYNNATNTSESLSLSGAMATLINDPNMTGAAVTVKWGSKTFTIPAGINGLKKIPNHNKYYYHNSVRGAGIASADFDQDRSTFSMKIENTALQVPTLTSPRNFGIKFLAAKDPNVFFDQTTSVGPQR